MPVRGAGGWLLSSGTGGRIGPPSFVGVGWLFGLLAVTHCWGSEGSDPPVVVLVGFGWLVAPVFGVGWVGVCGVLVPGASLSCVGGVVGRVGLLFEFCIVDASIFVAICCCVCV